MNINSINKLKLFSLGLISKFNENNLIFKSIDVTFTAGLKKFKGKGSYDGNKISYNFNGITRLLTINELLDIVAIDASSYDCVAITYSQRGSDILITADNKNVKMINQEIKESHNNKKAIIDKKNIIENNPDDLLNNNLETSTLLNRDYYIKVGKADLLLKEIGIMTADGKIKNDKIRKYNQIDRYVELLEGIMDKLPQNQIINILDCGCGKSYLTFVLNYYLTEIKKRKCHFIGLDRADGVIEASKKMSEDLNYRNMEFHALDINEYIPKKKIHVVISLHACDTATDMALALGIKVEANAIIAVPCCHREMLSKYSYAPFKNIIKHGVFKSRMADILTDGMRSLMLEAKGYEVSIVEYISPLETPKNLMIRAVKVKDEDQNAMEEYMELMEKLNIYPTLYSLLNQYE